ncbi:unnamed protein product, partial [Rotaria sordida]
MLSPIKRFFPSSILQTRSMVIKLCQCQNSIQISYPPSVQIEKLTIQELLKPSSNMKNICDITAQSFGDPSYRMNDAIVQSTHIYLARIKSRYIGYLMVDFEFGLSVYNEESLIYPILGCIDPTWKRKGIMRFIVGHFVRDIQQYQQQNSRKVLVWFTTVTPYMIRTVQDFYINIQPRDDEYGSYDPKYVPVIEQIQSEMNWKVDHDRSRNGNRHPFIQYGILKNTSYNNEELERIQKVISDPKYR